MDKAYEMFHRNLKNLQSNIVTKMVQLETLLVSENLNEKVSITQGLISLCSELSKICGPDAPQWINQLLQLSNKLIGNRNDVNNKVILLNFIHKSKNEISLHNWKEGGYNLDLNFENIYDYYKSESKLPELFNELIKLLEKIINTEEVELGEAEKKFKFLLSVIQSNMNKSYYGDQSILNYLVFFIKEFLLNLSRSIPGLKEFFEAIISTANKIYNEFKETEKNTEKKIREQLNIENLTIYNTSGELAVIEKELNKKIDFLI